ncbi:MAG: hypothetical protein CMP11_05020 [Zetaproteobacteria bacterium]|nr:hypothetical protein [Pseudobdellovibrionaceae bacterium]
MFYSILSLCKVGVLNIKQENKVLKNYLSPYWKIICVATVCSILFGIASTAVATMIGPVLNVLLNTKINNSFHMKDILGPYLSFTLSYLGFPLQITKEALISSLPLLFISSALIKNLFFIIQNVIWERVGAKIERKLRLNLVSDFLSTSPTLRGSKDFINKESQFSSIVTTDIKLMREYMIHFYGSMPREIFQVVLLAMTLCLLSAKLFIIYFFALAPAILIVKYLGRKVEKKANSALNEYSQLSEWTQQRLLGIETIKQYKTEKFETKKLEQLTADLFKKTFQLEKSKAWTGPLLEFTAITALVLALFFALNDVYQGLISGSLALSFFATIAILIQSAAKIGRYINKNREGVAAIKRVENILTYLSNKKMHDNHKRNIIKNDLNPQTLLEIEDASIRYPGQKKFALKNFSYTFEKGQIYCIFGSSGSGKSSLLKAILGLIELGQGKIFYDKSLLNLGSIGYISQQIFIIPGSIKENIIYPKSEGSDIEVKSALEKVGLTSFIESLDLGMATQIDTHEGRTISGGQEQRILLARLFYHSYPLLIMDEATSAVDPKLEEKILTNIHEVIKANKKTSVLFVTHRNTAKKFADKIIEIKEGELALT